MLGDPQVWLAFLTLSALEIVLGIDNIIFISILIGHLPRERQRSARIVGLALAMLTRIALLFSIVWLTTLTGTLFSVAQVDISGRDLVLAGGGLFLLVKSTLEIHATLEGAAQPVKARAQAAFVAIVVQIAIIDIVFSLDSVFTAVGMANQVSVMVAAIVVSILVMMWASGPIADFVDHHPTVKMLALAFLVLVGVALIGEGLDFHMPKGYMYFAMAFSVVVEMVNIRLRKLLDARRHR
jgi:predicted tellurium resistance membrane protein TerC